MADDGTLGDSWTPKDRERKKKSIKDILSFSVDSFQKHHPDTHQPCARSEALEIVRSMQQSAVAGFARLHGFAVAAKYRALIDEVILELEAN
jgi:hypothetical protein